MVDPLPAYVDTHCEKSFYFVSFCFESVSITNVSKCFFCPLPIKI